MADKKPTGFRFRLPWLLQPAPTPTPAPETPTQPPRTTTQTSVASTSASRPPFRPPGKAPGPPPPASPAQVWPQPVASPPTPAPVPAKPSVPKSSPISKTIEPVESKPTKETQTTNESIPTVETPSLATSPQRSLVRTTRQAESQPSPPQSPPSQKPDSQPSTPPQTNSQSLSPSRMPAQPQPTPPQSPHPTKANSQSSSLSRIRTPPQSNWQPLSPSSMTTQPQPSPPQSPLPTKLGSQPSSPSRIRTPPPANSQPSSPSRMAIKPHVPTKPSSPVHEATRSRATTHPLSPTPAQPSQTHIPPRSASQSHSWPKNEISLSSPHTETISSPIPHHTPEIKRSSEITQDHIPMDSNYVPQDDDLALHAKPTKTRLMYPHSMEAKTQKTKPATSTRVPLIREIKDDISKFIHNVTTTTPEQSIDEKSTSVITLAGDNTGASMHLSSDAIKRNYNHTTNKTDHDAINHEHQETKAIVNSNIQGINNSMMFNSSITERNSGVHLKITYALANTDALSMKNTESVEMQRAEVNITPPHKLVYDPTNDESIGGVFEDPNEYEQDDHEVSPNEIEVL